MKALERGVQGIKIQADQMVLTNNCESLDAVALWQIGQTKTFVATKSRGRQKMTFGLVKDEQ